MRKPEQRLWDRTRRNISARVHVVRVENAVGEGTPDSIAIVRGCVTWMEHKVGYWPQREGSRIRWSYKLQPGQCNWHKDWARQGGRTIILIGIERQLFVWPGMRVDEVNGLTRKTIAPYERSWNELINFLGGT